MNPRGSRVGWLLMCSMLGAACGGGAPEPEIPRSTAPAVPLTSASAEAPSKASVDRAPAASAAARAAEPPDDAPERRQQEQGAPGTAPAGGAIDCKLETPSISFGLRIERGGVVGGSWAKAATREYGEPRYGGRVIENSWFDLEIVGDDVRKGTRLRVRWLGKTLEIRGEKQLAGCEPESP
ncbi:MAG: hypothetical protein IT374_13360 [Polyangiaceae bacterium]|nr:hypothetical protein [Polyangiaceae bacterium]